MYIYIYIDLDIDIDIHYTYIYVYIYIYIYPQIAARVVSVACHLLLRFSINKMIIIL